VGVNEYRLGLGLDWLGMFGWMGKKEV